MAKITLKKFIDKIPYLIIFFNIFFIVFFLWQNRWSFQNKFDPQRLKSTYEQSVYIINVPHQTFTLTDEDLYAYAGWYYLNFGKIGKINIEHPPLGKYIIGLSIKFFGNQNVGQIYWGISFLILSFFFVKKLIQNNFISAAIVLLLSIEPLFGYQLTHSLLDLPQAVLLLIFLNFFPGKKDNFIYSGITLGLLAAIKFPAMAVILSLAVLSHLLVHGKKSYSKVFVFWLKINLTALLIFSLSYLPLLIQAGFINLIKTFITATKIHLSHVPNYQKLVIFRVLLFNQWPKWWGDFGIRKVDFWQLSWPIIGIAFLLSPIVLKYKKYFLKNSLTFIFCWYYLFFLSSRLFFPNYILPLMPFGFAFFFALIFLFIGTNRHLSD